MNNKIALVTGAGKRIGQAIAERLLIADYRVIVHAHESIKELTTWVNSDERKHQVIGIISANLANVDGQEFLIKEVKRLTKSLDLLVNNASTFSPKPFVDVEREDLKQMLTVNLEAPYFITQGLLPELKSASSPSVINILDAMWERPSKRFSHYAVSKAALAIFTRAMGNELAPQIRVNAISPGAILFQPFHTEEVRRKTIAGIPAKRLGTPSDIAEAVVFMSDQCHYAYGEIFAIDGGRSIAS